MSYKYLFYNYIFYFRFYRNFMILVILLCTKFIFAIPHKCTSALIFLYISRGIKYPEAFKSIASFNQKI